MINNTDKDLANKAADFLSSLDGGADALKLFRELEVKQRERAELQLTDDEDLKGYNYLMSFFCDVLRDAPPKISSLVITSMHERMLFHKALSEKFGDL